MVHSDIPEFLREVKIQLQALNLWVLPDPKYQKCRIQCSIEPGMKIHIFLYLELLDNYTGLKYNLN